MDELVGDHAPWDLDKHLSGCLAGYQTDPSYGAAVYFALEVLSGIARDVAIRADSGAFGPNQLDADWIISPNIKLPVPWIWIRALSAAWDRYKTERGPLGVAFGLEGGGACNCPPDWLGTSCSPGGEKENPNRGPRPGRCNEV
jgi:hypothetical protein